jgi:L-fuculose-phosphate aldolase
VHTHSHFCSALACLRRDIPAFHYMVAKAGGDSIRCSAYATFGTQALSDAVVTALADRSACLMANHGMIALGGDLQAALLLAQEVESLAGQYCQALQLGQPVLLDAAEMVRVAQQFESYGQTRQVD